MREVERSKIQKRKMHEGARKAGEKENNKKCVSEHECVCVCVEDDWY